METEDIVLFMVHILEIFGALVIIYGALQSIVQYAMNLFQKTKKEPDLRKNLALGLEFLMGAEIVRTIIVRTLTELAMLGGIIALRGLLGLIIHWEEKTD
ncbi:MAG TPA: DUF1622 domain-containing protein [Actinobacteria bacterium]|nr:DUF1622 domain-containing protein [Actinomycetota bacterium]